MLSFYYATILLQAKRQHKSKNSFSRAYNYGIVPKTPTLIKIADYFNISIEYLMGITDVELYIYVIVLLCYNSVTSKTTT